MKNYLKILLVFISIFGYAQTPITDDNIQTAIETCLSTNPVDGMCSDSEFGAMPDWDVSQVTDMNNAFKDKNTFNGDISAWDTSSVTIMNSMFGYARAFNQDISNWDVSNVTNMEAMFLYASVFNGDISSWDVSNVTNMYDMFRSALSFNGDISSWDVSSVTNMKYTFYGTSFNVDISSWDVSSVTNMRGMFYAADFNQNIGSWDVSSVTNMDGMFSLGVLSVENYDALLTGWSALTLQQGVLFSNNRLQYCTAGDARQSIIEIYGWRIIDAGLSLQCNNSDDLIPITDDNFQTAVNNCLVTNPVDGMCTDSEYGAMPDWDVSSVTYMKYAFYGASFNGDISSWDVSSVTNMIGMFYAADFNQNISSWCVTNIVSEPSNFSSNSSLSESNKPVWGTCPTAGLDDQNQLDISIYPNPTSDMVFVEGNYTQLKVIIYNVLGKEILNKSITNSIDISHLDNGVYILQLSDGVKLSTRKIIKN